MRDSSKGGETYDFYRKILRHIPKNIMFRENIVHIFVIWQKMQVF